MLAREKKLLLRSWSLKWFTSFHDDVRNRYKLIADNSPSPTINEATANWVLSWSKGRQKWSEASWEIFSTLRWESEGKLDSFPHETATIKNKSAFLRVLDWMEARKRKTLALWLVGALPSLCVDFFQQFLLRSRDTQFEEDVGCCLKVFRENWNEGDGWKIFPRKL